MGPKAGFEVGRGATKPQDAFLRLEGRQVPEPDRVLGLAAPLTLPEGCPLIPDFQQAFMHEARVKICTNN